MDERRAGRDADEHDGGHAENLPVVACDGAIARACRSRSTPTFLPGTVS
jgi:hypothetical protein